MTSVLRSAPQFDEQQLVRATKWLREVKDFLEHFSDDDETPLDHGLPTGDVIEVITLQYAVKLVPNLLHFSDDVRINVVLHLIGLAKVFQPDLDTVVPDLHDSLQHVLYVDADGDGQVEYEELFKAIHNLFSLIGKHIAPIAVGLVAGIESYYHHSDPTVQEIAMSAATRLIFENAQAFSRMENLSVSVTRTPVSTSRGQRLALAHKSLPRLLRCACSLHSSNAHLQTPLMSMQAIWNIYFLLDSKAAPSTSAAELVDSGRRVAVIQSLSVLAPIYTVSDNNSVMLTSKIVSRLLSLPDKSANEIICLKSSLSRVFAEVAGGNRSGNGGAGRGELCTS